MIQENGGFIFNGVSCKSLGLEYAPELQDTYIYDADSFKINEEAFEGHDGGYYYGSTVNSKEFTLRCFFEEHNINKGILTKVSNAFKRGTTGKLIFDSRPWCWYIATVTNIDTSKITNFLNGYVTVKLKAYYPFSRYDTLYIKSDDMSYYNILSNSALLNQDITPISNVVDGTPITHQSSLNDRTFILYNGGTERAKVAVEIQGDVGLGGVTISNATTNQKMRIVKMTGSSATSGSDYYMCDGLTGKCILNNTLKFEWHDYGFIELDPAYPIKRDIVIDVSDGSGSYVVTSQEIFDISDKGKYLYIDGQWREITTVDTENNSLTISGNNITPGLYLTNLVTMNKIIVTPGSTMNITKLNFRYKPTFS